MCFSLCGWIFSCVKVHLAHSPNDMPGLVDEMDTLRTGVFAFHMIVLCIMKWCTKCSTNHTCDLISLLQDCTKCSPQSQVCSGIDFCPSRAAKDVNKGFSCSYAFQACVFVACVCCWPSCVCLLVWLQVAAAWPHCSTVFTCCKVIQPECSSTEDLHLCSRLFQVDQAFCASRSMAVCKEMSVCCCVVCLLWVFLFSCKNSLCFCVLSCLFVCVFICGFQHDTVVANSANSCTSSGYQHYD